MMLYIFTIAFNLNNAKVQAKNALGFGYALNVIAQSMGTGANCMVM